MNARTGYLSTFVCTLVLGYASWAFADTVSSIARLSTNATGEAGNGASLRSSISANGALIAFETQASNLARNDTNGVSDIIVKSTTSNALKRASLGRKGKESNGAATNPSISPKTPNGTYVVVYESDATNLARNKQLPDVNGFQDIYATILPRGFTFRVSRGLAGGLANGRSDSPDIALLAEPNRLFISYASKASNLTTDDGNNFSDVYLTKLTAPNELPENAKLEDRVQTIRISKTALSGSETDGDSAAPQISGDGNYIVFESDATNLVPNLTTNRRQIFLYDIRAAQMSLVSKNLRSEIANADCRGASINYNGRYVTFLTAASNLLADGKVFSRPTQQVMRFDRESGALERVNLNASGIAGDAPLTLVSAAKLDASGRFVAFVDRASNLVSGDGNGSTDVFLKDMATGELSLVSRNADGTAANGASFAPALNRDGFTALSGLLSFASNSSDLVPNDSEGQTDIFGASLEFSPPPLTPETTLNVPPQIALQGRSARFSLEQFSSFVQTARDTVALRALPASSSGKQEIRYLISYRRISEDGTRGELSKLVTKRNSISTKNLSPGTYTSRYKVQVRESGKTLSESKSSPSQRFTIE